MSFCIILRRWPLLKFLASLLPNPQRREFASRAWERKLRISRCFVQGHIVDWCSSIWGANECCFSTFWSSPNLQERWEYLDIAFFECLSTLSWRVIFIQKIKFAELEFTRGHQMSTVVRGLQGRDGAFLRMVHFSRWILWKCHMPNMFFRCFFPHLEHHKNPPRILFRMWAKVVSLGKGRSCVSSKLSVERPLSLLQAGVLWRSEDLDIWWYFVWHRSFDLRHRGLFQMCNGGLGNSELE